MPWTHVLQSGYRDVKGEYVGGSEITHLAAYRGKMYATNGYWMDARQDTQSAQVLIQEGANARWRVELDFSKAADLWDVPGASFSHAVRGTVLKALDVTKDSKGKSVSKKLLLAAGLVYMADDGTTGKNTHIMVGKPIKNLMKTPRDAQVYTDPTTKEQRIFMLVGNYGVVSGVYDANSDDILWDGKPEETSATGHFRTRALGLTEQSGKLYFSAGGQIWVRRLGQAKWKVTFQHSGSQLSDAVGGVRGLSSVDKDSDEGSDKLIYVWAPNSKTKADIRHLSAGNEVEEFKLQTLFGHYGKGVRGSGQAKYALGAFNNFYKITDPRTKKSMHIMGLMSQVSGAAQVRMWHSFYGGAIYAVRENASTYHVGEVNGVFRPGRPPLVAARTFMLSPFPGEEHVLYVGGFDANYYVSTNTAWVYKAGLGVVLRRSTLAKGCGICVSEPGLILDRNAVAGMEGLKNYTCEDADAFLEQQSVEKGCIKFPDGWKKNCCMDEKGRKIRTKIVETRTPAPTTTAPPPAPPPATPPPKCTPPPPPPCHSPAQVRPLQWRQADADILCWEEPGARLHVQMGRRIPEQPQDEDALREGEGVLEQVVLRPARHLQYLPEGQW
eukprot:CAMPEP_0171287316 /NCGR_PEP_ID=MMETSP0790-20130122/69483_1 /TAXON_ID=2925 /ORGANISM="Alexandrium catenella, Strain OF101" /LENGTH=609 /DNA_ID=CAMNT_0011756823 /DNA_START=27 /DNA_END=1856 /DNA_ORIENTATION=+